jgi:uncharacterized protein DUF1844
MSEEKKQDFVVSDRRRFGSEGEVRSDVRLEEEKPAAPPQRSTPPPQQQQPEATSPAEESHEMPAPPTAEEQHEQNEAYRASGKKLDELFSAKMGTQSGYPEMSFEKVIESFYMSALIQMGAIRQEGEPTGVDIIGARQTIDSLTILQEKTKGNLTDREQTLLQNVLFELRMAWIELTNAIAKSATSQPAPGAPPTPDQK